MRIRKNAKISELLNSSPNLSRDVDECVLQKQNLCQLNQSPWDIITFPSSDSSAFHLQFDNNDFYYNVNLSGNGNSIDSSADLESVAKYSKTSELGENDRFNGKFYSIKKDYCEHLLGFIKEEREKSDEIQEEIKLCGKPDEKGRQCGNVVNYSNTICDYHLSELQNGAVWSTNKKTGPVSGLTTGRCNGRKKRPTTSPNDYYYYSGFGPSWGKKRGVLGKGLKSEISGVGPMELNYIDDDDDDGRGIMGIFGKKRGRKPIKEKSLKSLMG